MIAAIKKAIAIYANDAEWARVRPPLLELTTGQEKLLDAELKAIDFAMTGMERASFSEHDTNAQLR
jgi:4-hydroxy-tetrahydrodipicolinate synthase